MSEQYLSCNLRNCGKRLKEQAYVTSCSHIFCVEHGQRALKNNSPAECMVCGTKIDKQYDFVLINLNPTDQYKSMILTGLHPDIVLEIASRSVSYYIYQLSFDNNNKDNIIKQIKRQNDEIKQYCQNLHQKYKNDLVRIQNKLSSMQKEVDDKSKVIEMKEHQLTEANRYIKKLQIQLDSQKREILRLKSQKDPNEAVLFCNTSSSLPRTPRFNFPSMANDNFLNIFDMHLSKNQKNVF